MLRGLFADFSPSQDVSRRYVSFERALFTTYILNILSRPHGYRFWRNRPGRSLHREQAGYGPIEPHEPPTLSSPSATARQGCTVIIPFREEMAQRHLKLTGDLGRIVFTEWDMRNTESIEQSVRHSDVVYNLIGRNYPTKYASEPRDAKEHTC
jgi:hypothetical protein